MTQLSEWVLSRLGKILSLVGNRPHNGTQVVVLRSKPRVLTQVDKERPDTAQTSVSWSGPSKSMCPPGDSRLHLSTASDVDLTYKDSYGT